MLRCVVSFVKAYIEGFGPGYMVSSKRAAPLATRPQLPLWEIRRRDWRQHLARLQRNRIRRTSLRFVREFQVDESSVRCPAHCERHRIGALRSGTRAQTRTGEPPPVGYTSSVPHALASSPRTHRPSGDTANGMSIGVGDHLLQFTAIILDAINERSLVVLPNTTSPGAPKYATGHRSCRAAAARYGRRAAPATPECAPRRPTRQTPRAARQRRWCSAASENRAAAAGAALIPGPRPRGLRSTSSALLPARTR